MQPINTTTKHENDTASAVETAGPAGSEGLAGAPLILEDLLRNCTHPVDEHDAFAAAGLDETPGRRLVRMVRESYALVHYGHVHVGLIYPESRSLIEPLVKIAEDLTVVYDFGAASIYTSPAASQPVVETRDDCTVWDFVQDHPSKIRQVSIYVLEGGRLEMICTKPARGSYNEEEHT